MSSVFLIRFHVQCMQLYCRHADSLLYFYHLLEIDPFKREQEQMSRSNDLSRALKCVSVSARNSLSNSNLNSNFICHHILYEKIILLPLSSYFMIIVNESIAALVVTGAIIFGSDQEVREVMRAVRRNNATGSFSWIGSDGWSARNLVSDGNEPENPVKNFIYFKKAKMVAGCKRMNAHVIDKLDRMLSSRKQNYTQMMDDENTF
ncbi:hypothetical protein GQX74_012278 [Glossina fuscipes]|nr:hypothetical protein GQX74_012278 [Glossina fuscipes]